MAWAEHGDPPRVASSTTPYTWGHPEDSAAAPDVRYAGWGRRGVGFLLDFLLMACAPIAFFVFFGLSVPASGPSDAPFSAVSWVLFWCLLASGTVFVFYPAWFIAQRGQTPGMKRMGIRLSVIDREGNMEAPGWNQAWGRAATACACWLFVLAWLLDYLWPLGDTRHQCLHDKLARTVVVNERVERR